MSRFILAEAQRVALLSGLVRASVELVAADFRAIVGAESQTDESTTAVVGS